MHQPERRPAGPPVSWQYLYFCQAGVGEDTVYQSQEHQTIHLLQGPGGVFSPGLHREGGFPIQHSQAVAYRADAQTLRFNFIGS